jgi:two-component system OmpR family response regulator
MRLLIAEDDQVLGDGLTQVLRGAGYVVDWARDGADADAALTQFEYDAVILDLGLPRLDGLEVLRRLRGRGLHIPVLILTARDSVADKVAGLDVGADDYMVKPFDIAELEARVRALVRRGKGSAGAVLEFGNVRYDSAAKRVFVDEAPVDLTARELGVFEVLALHAGSVVNKDQIVTRLCEAGEEVNAGAIEVYVHRLRKKLEQGTVTIRTIRGLGYLLEAPAREP